MTPENDSEYIPRDDESELARLGNHQGIGDTVFLDDEDVRAYSLQDYGLTGTRE